MKQSNDSGCIWPLYIHQPGKGAAVIELGVGDEGKVVEDGVVIARSHPIATAVSNLRLQRFNDRSLERLQARTVLQFLYEQVAQ